MMGLPTTTALLLLVLGSVRAQEEAAACYGPGAIAASVLLTLIVAALVVGALYFLWLKVIKPRKEQHLILETDPERGKEEYAFDNPGFKDAGFSPPTKPIEKSKVDSSGGLKTKWNQWSPLNALSVKNEKKQTLDDSAIENVPKIITLRSHDFTGLGFNICGNMKDGIYIKDVLHRGPAFESGRMNVGDRINSVTISFEHIVYEDALAILSYASPYELIISATSGRTPNFSGQHGKPVHPVYRSSSSTDLSHVEKSSKRRLFQPDDSSDIGSNYSSLQKSRSNATTLERKGSKSPKPPRSKPKTKLSPEQLKSQLEENIVEDYKEAIRAKNEVVKIESEVQQKQHHKFGVQVFPNIEARSPKILEQNEHNVEQKSPKILEQNENNVNLEILSIDEVDKVIVPVVKKREKIAKEAFERSSELNESGIKRDENNIPLEIPDTMANAAIAARKNRKSLEEEDEVKSPKKLKGKAPLPPPNIEDECKFNILNKSDDSIEKMRPDSDSDGETDNQSSVNTIELNASDITVHQSEESEEKRKTASTGDLTKIHKTRKTSSGTLERAQSLDITDAAIPTLSKKRRIDESFDSKTSSDDSLYGNALLNKEPRLSLILDGLNTFQRSRLKKSTEWGNLEDAVLKDGSAPSLERSAEDLKVSSAESFASPEFDALVNKINEIKQETIEIINEQERKIDVPEITSEELEEICDEDVPKTMETMSRTIEDMPKSMEEVVVEEVKVRNRIWPCEFEVDKADLSQFIAAEREAYLEPVKHEDTNVSDDFKVSRHSMEHPNNVSNITITDVESYKNDANKKSVIVSTPDLIKNITIAEALHDVNNEVTVEGPTSLTFEIPAAPEFKYNGHQMRTNGDINKVEVPSVESDTANSSLTYITEIQVVTSPKAVSEIEIDSAFENYIKTFEANSFESTSPLPPTTTTHSIVINETVDAEKELMKVQERVEEQLKKLPEMRFTTSSYEKPPEKRQSQIEILRSNFEKSTSPPRSIKPDISKSRIPVLNKTPPTSPERRDSKEADPEILEIVGKRAAARNNVTVTSIRSNSKIPSGLRPPVPPRTPNGDGFRQWVFTPSDTSVTNITLTESSKYENK